MLSGTPPTSIERRRLLRLPAPDAAVIVVDRRCCLRASDVERLLPTTNDARPDCLVDEYLLLPASKLLSLLTSPTSPVHTVCTSALVPVTTAVWKIASVTTKLNSAGIASLFPSSRDSTGRHSQIRSCFSAFDRYGVRRCLHNTFYWHWSVRTLVISNIDYWSTAKTAGVSGHLIDRVDLQPSTPPPKLVFSAKRPAGTSSL